MDMKGNASPNSGNVLKAAGRWSIIGMFSWWPGVRENGLWLLIKCYQVIGTEMAQGTEAKLKHCFTARMTGWVYGEKLH